jgi:hypothetical protein
MWDFHFTLCELLGCFGILMECEPVPTRLRPRPGLGRVHPALFFIFRVGVDLTASGSSCFQIVLFKFHLFKQQLKILG